MGIPQPNATPRLGPRQVGPTLEKRIGRGKRVGDNRIVNRLECQHQGEGNQQSAANSASGRALTRPAVIGPFARALDVRIEAAVGVAVDDTAGGAHQYHAEHEHRRHVH